MTRTTTLNSGGSADALAAAGGGPVAGTAASEEAPRSGDIPAPEAPGGEGGGQEGESPVVVRVENLGKRFKIYRKPLHRMHEWIFGTKRHTEFWAVRGVSFEVRRGECMGIIGANGSGKSTLLKMIAGALRPTEGTFNVQGRVLSLIELGTGLNPQLTGRANIVHATTLLGFPVTFAREKMKEIEAFAELGEFFDRPVVLYSSGMRVRLAFSMFACFRPELFIVDEALSVGDIFFQQKCAVRIRELLEGGMTMLFVSHDQSAILNLCDRAMVLSRSRPIFYGEPEEAVTRYIASLRQEGRARSKWERSARNGTVGRAGAGAAVANGPADGAASRPEQHSARTLDVTEGAARAREIIEHDVIGARREHRHGSGKALILACRVTNSRGRDTVRASMGDVLTFHVLIEAHEDVEAPRAGIRFFDRFNNLVFGAGTFQLKRDLPPLRAGERMIVRFDVTMDVGLGQYTFGLGTGEPSQESSSTGEPLDRLDLLGPIIVGAPADGHRTFHGTARLPMAIDFERLGGMEEAR